MALYSPRASGLGNSAAYQVAGKPYVTGSTVEANPGGAGGQVKIEFPTVTKNITIGVTGSASLKVHFDSVLTSDEVTNNVHYFPVFPTTTTANHLVTFGAKCKEIYISGTGAGQSGFVLYAELTGIPASEMYELTGSGINS